MRLRHTESMPRRPTLASFVEKEQPSFLVFSTELYELVLKEGRLSCFSARLYFLLARTSNYTRKVETCLYRQSTVEWSEATVDGCRVVYRTMFDLLRRCLQKVQPCDFACWKEFHVTRSVFLTYHVWKEGLKEHDDRTFDPPLCYAMLCRASIIR